MSLSIGLQLFSVREALQKDPTGTLEKVSEIGYENLELAIHHADASTGYTVGGLTASRLKEQMGRLGLKALNAMMYPITDVKWEPLVAFCQEIGMPAVSCSMSISKNKAEALAFARILNECGEICRKHGLQFYYHNHFQEFQVFEGQTVMDILLDNTDKDLVKIEFDTYWALRGGVDPIAWLRKLGDRCDLVHQKDLPVDVRPVSWFDVLGYDIQWDFEQHIQLRHAKYFTEIGSGKMDIPGIVSTIKDMGVVRTIFVEQDMTSLGEFESAAINFERLTKLVGR